MIKFFSKIIYYVILNNFLFLAIFRIRHFDKMKNLKILIGLILGLTLIGCSSDDADNNGSQKKLTKIIHNVNGHVILTQNLLYDKNNNLIEINDENGLVESSYNYNSINNIIQVIDYQYNDDNSNFEMIKNISYNNDNKISNIEEIFNVYNADDGTLNYQNNSNRIVTYGNNSISIVYDDISNRKVELVLSNNLITRVKIFSSNVLESDMIFSYDNEGNCISGRGAYEPGLYDTTDIDLNVIYGEKEKHAHFNTLFDYNILFNSNSFFLLKEVLVNQQGNRYPERIQWYQFEGWNYRDYIDYSIDKNGYIVTKRINIFNSNTYSEIITYTWE